MYIYKMTDDSGTFIGSSKVYPSTLDLRYAKQLSKMINPKITVLRDNVREETAQLEVFNESINEILSSDTYNLLNGRFNSIEPVMEYMGRHFILIVACKTTHRVYVKDSYNPIEKLYRLFVSHRGRSELINDLRTEGKDNFVVDIITTFDNPYHEMLRVFESYLDNGYTIYNESMYESLKSASLVVSKLKDNHINDYSEKVISEFSDSIDNHRHYEISGYTNEMDHELLLAEVSNINETNDELWTISTDNS